MDDPTRGQAAQVPDLTSSSDLASTSSIPIETGCPDMYTRQKHSILFKLPLELRLLVYREIFTPNSIDDFRHAHGQHPEILRTCSAIFAEAVPVLYQDRTTWIRARCFYDHGESPAFLVNNIRSDEKLSHLELILPYAQHLRRFNLIVSFLSGWENSFRHSLDCVFFFLKRMPRIDYLRVTLRCYHRDNEEYMAFLRRTVRQSVECVLGRLRNIRKAWIVDDMRPPDPEPAAQGVQNGDTQLIEVNAWEDPAKRMMGPEDKRERITSTLLDRYWALKKRSETITANPTSPKLFVEVIRYFLNQARFSVDRGYTDQYMWHENVILKKCCE